MLNNTLLWLIALSVSVLVLLTLLIAQAVAFARFKKRLGRFLQTGKPAEDIETMLTEYLQTAKEIETKVQLFTMDIQELSRRVASCIQKVGLVRYNPFDEMGGDLCFAAAFLDQNNNGIVLNTIYNRDASYTYAKPIVNKTSTYSLSDEEKKAIEMAVNKASASEPSRSDRSALAYL